MTITQLPNLFYMIVLSWKYSVYSY